MASNISNSPIHWSEFDFEIGQSQANSIQKTVDNKRLKNTNLSCTIDSAAGKWENRKKFIDKVARDVIKNCPKNEPLLFISLGADRLLSEYILGKTFIEEGFQDISFFLVDPVYAFSEPSNLKEIQKALADFREKIESLYSSIHKEKLSKERIRYLSRSQNIEKYFPAEAKANIVVLESLPPYAEIIKDIQQRKAPEKKPADLIVGGFMVDSKYANSIAFVPKQYVAMMNQAGARLKESLPIAILQNNQNQFYYLDWGCKLQTNGSYRLSFTGEEHYINSIGLSKEQKVKLSNGEFTTGQEWIPMLKKSIEKTITEEIKDDKKLSQEQLTAVLEKVKKVAVDCMPMLECYFLADYFTDQSELMTLLAAQEKPHYRRIFSLVADVDKVYRINIEEIS